MTAPNGNSGAIGSPAGYDNEILAFSPGGPAQQSVAISGLGDIVSMTVGPDGNIWFLDSAGAASDTGNTGPYVGELSTADKLADDLSAAGRIHTAASGWKIASGPATADSLGEGSVFFTAATTIAGPGTGVAEPDAAIGVISGIPFPKAVGTLSVERSLTVDPAGDG